MDSTQLLDYNHSPMSPRATKWTLWLLLCCTAPVPYMLGGIEIAPIIRLAFFASLTIVAHIFEGSGGSNWSAFIALGAVQTLLYFLGFYAIAALVSRFLLARFSSTIRAGVVAAIGATTLITFSVFPLYETPISSTSMYSTLLEVLQ